VQFEGHDLINVFLFRKVAGYAMIGDGGRQPVSVVV
jgi:hypothetical protein